MERFYQLAFLLKDLEYTTMINKPAALIAISFSFCNSTKVSNFIVFSLEVGAFGFINVRKAGAV